MFIDCQRWKCQQLRSGVQSAGEHLMAGLQKGRRDVVSDASDFVDEELAELVDEFSALVGLTKLTL